MSPHIVKGGYASSTIRNRSGGRRAAGVVAAIAKRGYRPDLRKVSVVLSVTYLDILFRQSDEQKIVACALDKPQQYLPQMHHLEPAGQPQGVMKVGCGHAVQDYLVQR